MGPGTVEYMSPEQIRGLPLDARSDLYSLGITLYEMLAGRVPFPAAHSDSSYDVLKAHIETKPPPVRTLNSAIPSSLADVVARSLEKDPDRRWQSAAEFREALLACQQDRSVTGNIAAAFDRSPHTALRDDCAHRDGLRSPAPSGWDEAQRISGVLNPRSRCCRSWT